MKKSTNRKIKIFLGLNIVLVTFFWSVLLGHAQYPFFNPFYYHPASYFAPLPFRPCGYLPPVLSTYNNYYPYAPASMLNSFPRLNPLSMPYLSMGLPPSIMSPMPFARIARQATSALPLTSISTSIVLIVLLSTSVAAPAIAPTILPGTSVAAPADTTLSVLIASLLINTGNPQVNAVLALIASDPTILDNPFLLNVLINTGNSQVALVLALLAGGLI